MAFGDVYEYLEVIKVVISGKLKMHKKVEGLKIRDTTVHLSIHMIKG